jgi:hypothetical protein
LELSPGYVTMPDNRPCDKEETQQNGEKIMISKKTLETYKAEAIEYRMCFGKAHEYQIDWLRSYFVKNPGNLPENIVPKEDTDRVSREKLKLIDDYVDWASSSDRIDGMPNKLKESIIKTFNLG